MWFEAIAWADAAAPNAAPAAASPQGFLDQMLANPMVPLVLVVAVFYFIIIRPQSQRLHTPDARGWVGGGERDSAAAQFQAAAARLFRHDAENPVGIGSAGRDPSAPRGQATGRYQ